MKLLSILSNKFYGMTSFIYFIYKFINFLFVREKIFYKNNTKIKKQITFTLNRNRIFLINKMNL